MSRQIRHRVKIRNRVTGTALAVLFAAAPLLVAGQAHADWAQSDNRLVFDGEGPFGLPCAARPDLQSLQVPTNSIVQVVNNTGHGANLVLDGKSLGGIPDEGSAQVVFHHGTVAVSLEPDCLLRDESAPVLVTAAPSTGPLPSGVTSLPTASPSTQVTEPTRPTPTPTRTTPTTPSPTPTGTSRPDPSPSPTRTTRPTRRPPTATPTSPRSTRHPSTSPTPSRTPRSITTNSDTRSDDTQTPTRTPSATPTSSAPAGGAPATTEPPLADDELFPGAAPTMDLLPSADPIPPAGSAAEPVATLEPLSRSGSNGLLALTAAVCVTGVMAGAVRTIAAQRASRANMA